MAIFYLVISRAVGALKKRSGLSTLKTHTFHRPTVHNRIIDLGANVGEFAIAATESTGATCYALEPVRANYDQIPNHPKIRKQRLAIADSAGEIEIFLSKNPECNSFYSSIASDYGISGREICQTTTLEAFLKSKQITSVDLLKIDIEGAEELLFSSTSDETLLRFGQITIEFHDFVPGSITSEAVDRITKRLRALGFEWLPLSFLNPSASTADVLFIQNNRCRIRDRLYFFFLRCILLLERRKQRLRTALIRLVTSNNLQR